MSTILYLSNIEFGAGTISTLPDALSALGVRLPFLISDHGLAATGLLDQVAALLPVDCASFRDVPTNPTEDAVLAGVAAYRKSGCDGIVAVGGGSPIDLAKGVALLATHEPPPLQYAAIFSAGSGASGPASPWSSPFLQPRAQAPKWGAPPC